MLFQAVIKYLPGSKFFKILSKRLKVHSLDNQTEIFLLNFFTEIIFIHIFARPQYSEQPDHCLVGQKMQLSGCDYGNKHA